MNKLDTEKDRRTKETDGGAEEVIQLPITVIRSFYPIRLLRLIYLSIVIFSDKKILNHAASAAFYFLLSIIPLALLSVMVFDIYIGKYVNISNQFFALLQSFNPKLGKEFFSELGFLSGKGRGTIFGTIGVLGLIWSSRSIFVSVKNTFFTIFSNSKESRFIKDTLQSFIAVPLVFALSFAVFLVNYVGKKLYHLSEQYGFTLVTEMARVDLFSSLINMAAIFLIAFASYRFLPDEKMKLSNTITGSIVFTILMLILQKLLASMLTLAGYYLVYGVISTMIVTLFAVYIIFILFYLSAQIVYVGEYFSQLEFSLYYACVARGKANFIERLIFFAPNATISKHYLTYRAGELIFDSNTEPDSLYILREGSVEVADEGRGEMIKRDQFFGVKAFLAGSKYLASATAKTDTGVLKIPRRFYDTLIKVDPSFANVIVDQLIKA